MIGVFLRCNNETVLLTPRNVITFYVDLILTLFRLLETIALSILTLFWPHKLTNSSHFLFWPHKLKNVSRPSRLKAQNARHSNIFFFGRSPPPPVDQLPETKTRVSKNHQKHNPCNTKFCFKKLRFLRGKRPNTTPKTQLFVLSNSQKHTLVFQQTAQKQKVVFLRILRNTTPKTQLCVSPPFGFGRRLITIISIRRRCAYLITYF